MPTRRRFIQIVPAAGASLLAGRAALAQAVVSEKDPQAVALGYTSDASKVDKQKYKNYQPGSSCANCTLYQGKPTDPTAPCPLFAGKVVEAKAWCTAWVKKG